MLKTVIRLDAVLCQLRVLWVPDVRLQPCGEARSATSTGSKRQMGTSDHRCECTSKELKLLQVYLAYRYSSFVACVPSLYHPTNLPRSAELYGEWTMMCSPK